MRMSVDYRLKCLSFIFKSALLLALISAGAARTRASDLLDVQPLTASILLLHFKDGHVEHHKRGEPRSQEKVIVDPLDTARASRADSYEIVSADDPAYRAPARPARVGRKSKGTEFAWFVDAWQNNRAVNNRPDHTSEHWLYLALPSPMKAGKTYTVNTGALSANGREWKLAYDLARSRSEAVHVNTLGYVPDAPAKYAYVYHWMGDLGSLDVKPLVGNAFHLIDTKTGAKVFSGKVAFRSPKTLQETFHISDTRRQLPCGGRGGVRLQQLPQTGPLCHIGGARRLLLAGQHRR